MGGLVQTEKRSQTRSQQVVSQRTSPPANGHPAARDPPVGRETSCYQHFQAQYGTTRQRISRTPEHSQDTPIVHGMQEVGGSNPPGSTGKVPHWRGFCISLRLDFERLYCHCDHMPDLKDDRLQIRVNPAEKRLLEQAAQSAAPVGLSVRPPSRLSTSPSRSSPASRPSLFLPRRPRRSPRRCPSPLV